MPVTYLTLENFKSYGGLQTIGPFQSFTSIIGPNGSGKSNCMDALSFVLGVQSRDLRSSQLKDLIFRPPGGGRQKLTASAKITYVDDVTGEETNFERKIHPNGNGEYLLNGKSVSYKDYEAKLGEIGVLVKARNFLVFQGDVESLARKTPKEFVDLLEQISQSAELKEEYDQAVQAKQEADSSTLFLFQQQKGLKGERKLLKEQTAEAERFQELLEEKAALQKEWFLWQIFHLEEERKECEEQLEALVEEHKEAQGLEEQQATVLKEAKKKASAARRSTQQADQHKMELSAKLEELEPSAIQLDETIQALESKLEKEEKRLLTKQKQAEDHQGKLKELETQMEDAKKDLKTLENDYEQAKKDAAPGDQAPLTQSQEEEYEQVKEAAASASVQFRQQLQKLQNKLESARATAQGATLEKEQLQKRQAQVTREIHETQDRIDRIEKVSQCGQNCIFLS